MKKKAFIVISLLICLVSGCYNNNINESTTMSDSSTPFNEKIEETRVIESNLNLNTLNGLNGLTPSQGNINILLIPVHFEGIENDNFNTNIIKKVFNGNKKDDELLWYGVSEFYEKSSYGKCHLNFEMTPIFEPSNSYSYYCSNYNNRNYTNASDQIVKEALNYFDNQYDYSLFDNNNDNYIDGVYLVYDAPVDIKHNDNLWWAYTTYYKDDFTFFDNKKIKSYVFAGYDFLFMDGTNKADSHTFIHEMAHMFGVDDYYDYQPSTGKKEGGLAGGDIMDGTIGDHNSITKALLNWNKGYLIKPQESLVVELDAMQNNGDFIILANDFDLSKNFAQEFFVLEYYTNTNLQEFDKIFTISGIRMLHINGKVDENGKFLYNNSYTSYKFISQITSSKGTTYLSNTTSRSDYSLFTANKELLEVKYDNGEKLNYTFKVNELTDSKAIIEIKKSIR